MRLLAIVLFAAATGLQAQAPYLVKDINTTNSFDTQSSSPRDFIAYGGWTYFIATTTTEGAELWRTGAGGTALVADIIPGSSGSNPTLYGVVNGLLLFGARTVDHGLELWATDGTAAGTRRVLDINPGPNSSTPVARFPQSSRMLFSADDGINGRELWVTDGTAAGTRLVKDINPGSAGSTPAYLTAFNGSVYFAAASDLWKTDGTDAGTIKVASVAARNLCAAGSRLFFEGFTTAAGFELWVSDGTEAGTRMVTEIVAGTKGGLATNFVGPMAILADRVVFAASDDVHGREPWISDGTAAGTRLLRDLVPGPTGRWDQGSPNLVTLGNRVFFSASDAAHGNELWATDGTESGTALFADLEPGTNSSVPYRFSVAGGKLFFAAGLSVLTGSRLWVVDGTAGGARVVASSTGEPVGMAGGQEVGGKLWFAGSTRIHGTEPWVSDGTDAGTWMMANIAPDGAPSSTPEKLTATNGLLFFHATEGVLSPTTNVAEASLWRTDGTEAGTFKLLETGQHPADLTGAGSMVLLRGSGRMMVSDGTVAGTTTAETFLRRFNGFNVNAYFPFGDTLFASVADRGNPYDTSLWKTTGAPHAPAIALGGKDPSAMIEVAGRYVFSAAHGNGSTRGLWTTDGTPAGTYPIVPRIEGSFGPLASASGSIFYVAGGKLWKSDGTLGGTVAVREVTSGVREIEGAGRNVFLVLERGVWDHVLWVSDGTAEGTVELRDLEPRLRDDDRMAPVGNRVVFTQRYDGGGYDLWGSDGTKSGTVALMTGGSVRPDQKAIDGIVYFAGRDEAHGTELWVTDGTVAGTKMLFDLNPGPASSWPSEFTKAGDTMYFRALTAATGDELWALPLAEPRLSIADAYVAEAEGGLARIAVTLSPAQPRSVTVEYATADRTARAGTDYDSAAGTLTFAPGQTSRTIDVRVRGDAAVENNESFFVTLRNAGGARIARDEAVAIVEDDDQAADLSVAATFLESGGSLYDGATVSNAGPSPSRNIDVHITITPAETYTGCRDCTIPQLLSGASAFTGGKYWSSFTQTYRSAIATARDADPQPANNTASWTLNERHTIGMTPAFLTPGATGRITALLYNTPGTPAVTSSDPSVLTVPAAIARTSDRITFDVTAVKPGTSTLTIAGTQIPLLVTVVPAGTTPRWPGALEIEQQQFSVRTLDKPLLLKLTPAGEAPLTGATATGTVTLTTSGGQELVRHTIRGAAPVEIPVWFRTVGATSFTIAYSGDAIFLPQTVVNSVFIQPGNVSITGGLAPLGGGSYELNAFVEGSPVVLPTGTLVVKSGGTEVARVTLQPSTGGRAKGVITLNNLPASPSVVVEYSGDAQYAAATQQMRLAAPRRRSSHP